MSTHGPIPEGILHAHVLAALAELDGHAPHDFSEPTQWLLVHNGRHYAPKAAIGLAAGHAFGSRLKPSEFSSGEGRHQAVGYLRGLNFSVVPKNGESTAQPAPTDGRVSLSHPERAVQVWHMLIAAARNRQSLTYKIIAETTGAFPAALGEILTLIMRWCEREQLPPLTVLVVRTGTGKPGPGLLTSENNDADREAVFEFAWYRLRPPAAIDLAKAVE